MHHHHTSLLVDSWRLMLFFFTSLIVGLLPCCQHSVCALNIVDWVQVGADIDGEAVNDEAGYSVALSADGSIVAVGERFNDDTGNKAGQVRVFQLNASSSWEQLGQDLNGESANDEKVFLLL